MNLKRGIWGKIKELFSIDVRSLAVLRIGLGLILIVDILSRARDLRAHYSDFGVLPRGVLRFEYGHHLLNKSINAFNGSTWYWAILFFIGFVFALMLLLGFKSKTASIGAWFFILILHARNFLILQGGDDLFRMVLFWCMFLPLGEIWSVDWYFRKKNIRIGNVFSIGSAALLIQIASVFIFSAIHKSEESWLYKGDAIYYALSLDQFTTILGKALLEFDSLLIFMSRFTYLLHFSAVFFLFFPYKNKWFRSIGAVLIACWFLGTDLIIKLWPFPFIGAIAMTAFIRGDIWGVWKVKEKRRKVGAIRIVCYVFCALCLIYVIVWNIGTINDDQSRLEGLFWFGDNLQLFQKWNMFSPVPLREDGWYIIVGGLENGKEINLFGKGQGLDEGKEVNWEKPRSVSSTYKNERWRKYMMNLWLGENKEFRDDYLYYICRDWNIDNKTKAKKVKMYFMLERTLERGLEQKVEKILLEEVVC